MHTAPCLHHQVKGLFFLRKTPFQGYSAWILLDHLGILGRDHLPPPWNFPFGGQHQRSAPCPPCRNLIGAVGGVEPGETAGVGLLQQQGELHRPAHLRPCLPLSLPPCCCLPRRGTQ